LSQIWLDVTLKDQIRSARIAKEFGIFNLNGKIRISENNWMCHVVRMEPHFVPAQIMNSVRKLRKLKGNLEVQWD
jgi:hypothetical protein